MSVIDPEPPSQEHVDLPPAALTKTDTHKPKAHLLSLLNCDGWIQRTESNGKPGTQDD
jgi:hypothetical protein